MIVYRHRRLDNNEIFYIGIGKTSKRAYSKRNRNKYWSNIVNKCGYQVEIIYNCNTWENACELEQLLIFEYGRKDLGTGCLVNMTDGGDGVINLIRTKEHNKKIGLGNKGKKVPKNILNALHKSNERALLQLTLDGKVLRTFKSTVEAQIITGIHSPNISSVCLGKRKTAGGYIWKYK